VYGFGGVLLKMVAGMRALNTTSRKQKNLVDWTKPCLSSKEKLKTIIDGRIEGQYS